MFRPGLRASLPRCRNRLLCVLNIFAYYAFQFLEHRILYIKINIEIYTVFVILEIRMLKAQDIVAALAVRLLPQVWTYHGLSNLTGISVSQCHSSCKRLREIGLLHDGVMNSWQVPSAQLTEFLVHGLRYVFPAQVGESTRGIPTAHSAPFVAEAFVVDAGAPALVWPTIDGEVRGNRLKPLHDCQLRCIAKSGSDRIYRALVCIDLLRVGQARERAWATTILESLLSDAKPS